MLTALVSTLAQEAAKVRRAGPKPLRLQDNATHARAAYVGRVVSHFVTAGFDGLGVAERTALAQLVHALAPHFGLRPREATRAEGNAARTSADLEAYLKKNPGVIRTLVVRCREEVVIAKARGRTRISFSLIIEKLRVDWSVALTPKGLYRIDNRHRPALARMVCAAAPDVAPFIEVRPLKEVTL